MTEFEKIDHLFTYHPPDPRNIGDYEDIREAGRMMARVIVSTCPASADRSAAIRKVREAVMTANAALACGEES
jgi:hypothetical protein